MATTSGDLQLYKPQYSESADVAKINDNMDIIDDAFTDLSGQTNGVAIVVDGDTAPKAIASGAYLFIKNHSTLPTGGYHATAAIASGASVTSGNVSADSNGIVNGAFNVLNSNIANQSFDKVNSTPINDLNSNIPNGLFEYGANTSNAPTTNGGVVLHCLIAYKNHGFQIAHANNQTYLSYRWKSADIWSEWKSLT